MKSEIVLVTVLAVLAIFLTCASIASVVYDFRKRKQILGTVDKDDWLFSGIHEMFYRLFCKGERQESFMGINYEEYENYCQLIHKRNDVETIMGKRIEGMLAAAVFLVLGYMVQESSFTIAVLFWIAAAFMGYILYIAPYDSVKKQASERKFRIVDDMPRFFALLEKALDFPIDKAIMITATKFESPLSDDLLDCINKVSLGADGWQQTLVELAKVYDYDPFNDFVLELINSYEQGSDIRHLVTRRVHEMEQSRLFEVEQHDAKIKTMMFLPIMVFKIIPMMVLVGAPMMMNIM